MTFHIGQKVVCVDDTGFRFRNVEGLPTEVPKKGNVYTIRGFDLPDEIDPGTGILLDEIRNPLVTWSIRKCEASFLVHRFRPVIERKTDISIFTAMLDPSRNKELCGND